jgi:excisionase family DNA binding protein
MSDMGVERIVEEFHQLVDTGAAAAYLGVTPGTLAVWRSTRRYNIPYVKVGSLVYYRRSELDEWLARRTVCFSQDGDDLCLPDRN